GAVDAVEVPLEALPRRAGGALGERCDLVPDHDRKRSPKETTGLERVRQLPQDTVELPDPCVEVADPGDADGLALGRQELGELSSHEKQVCAEGCDVLERAVMQVEGQAAQAPL